MVAGLVVGRDVGIGVEGHLEKEVSRGEAYLGALIFTTVPAV